MIKFCSVNVCLFHTLITTDLKYNCVHKILGSRTEVFLLLCIVIVAEWDQSFGAASGVEGNVKKNQVKEQSTHAAQNPHIIVL